ncbi:hypothetical protein U1Q18_020315 [Sarracenia purpurea var. burkii]
MGCAVWLVGSFFMGQLGHNCLGTQGTLDDSNFLQEIHCRTHALSVHSVMEAPQYGLQVLVSQPQLTEASQGATKIVAVTLDKSKIQHNKGTMRSTTRNLFSQAQ